MVKKVEVCSMLAKININLKKDFESISIKCKKSKEIDTFLNKHFAGTGNS